MNKSEAQAIGRQVGSQVRQGRYVEGYTLLEPVLGARTAFRLLDSIGKALWETTEPANLQNMNDFFVHIASRQTMGGWVVIGSALREQLATDMPVAFNRCRQFVMIASVWHAADSLGERVPGPALTLDITRALSLLSPWRQDANRWVRRTAGVAAHFWAKRAHGEPEHADNAKRLLEFLSPMFEEENPDAIKGVGWGLKTLGKYYPDMAIGWLDEQLLQKKRNPRALMLRKALTYLPENQCARLKIR